MSSYNRYSRFIDSDGNGIVPYIEIATKESDKYITYNGAKDRLDAISYKYYGDSGYGWLIMQANPEYGSMEFNIPTGALIRVPYPLATTLSLYNEEIDNYKEIN